MPCGGAVRCSDLAGGVLTVWQRTELALELELPPLLVMARTMRTMSTGEAKIAIRRAERRVRRRLATRSSYSRRASRLRRCRSRFAAFDTVAQSMEPARGPGWRAGTIGGGEPRRAEVRRHG